MKTAFCIPILLPASPGIKMELHHSREQEFWVLMVLGRRLSVCGRSPKKHFVLDDFLRRSVNVFLYGKEGSYPMHPCPENPRQRRFVTFCGCPHLDSHLISSLYCLPLSHSQRTAFAHPHLQNMRRPANRLHWRCFEIPGITESLVTGYRWSHCRSWYRRMRQRALHCCCYG